MGRIRQGQFGNFTSLIAPEQETEYIVIPGVIAAIHSTKNGADNPIDEPTFSNEIKYDVYVTSPEMGGTPLGIMADVISINRPFYIDQLVYPLALYQPVMMMKHTANSYYMMTEETAYSFDCSQLNQSSRGSNRRKNIRDYRDGRTVYDREDVLFLKKGFAFGKKYKIFYENNPGLLSKRGISSIVDIRKDILEEIKKPLDVWDWLDEQEKQRKRL